jgi:3,4-dihydroxy-2-butanone 4-phosphate synthase
MTCCWVFLVEKTERGTCERRGQGEMSTKVLEHVGLNHKWVFLE